MNAKKQKAHRSAAAKRGWETRRRGVLAESPTLSVPRRWLPYGPAVPRYARPLPDPNPWPKIAAFVQRCWRRLWR